jgi:hypothetical protein
LAVSAQLHGSGTEGAERPRSGRDQQDRVTVAFCLPNIIPFGGTQHHTVCWDCTTPRLQTSGRPAAQWQRQLSLSSRHCGVVLAFVRLIIEPIVFCVSSDKQMTKSPPPAGAIVLPADIGTSRCWIIARFLSTSFTTSHGSLCTQRTRNLLPSRDRGRYWLTVALFFTAF